MTTSLITTSLGGCAREGCTIAAGGSCAREFTDPYDCEDFEPDEVPADNGAEGGDPVEAARITSAPLDTRGRRPWRPSDDVEALHSGQALTLEEATRVRQGHPSVVVVPVGGADVGKTTLFAALYERLSGQPVGGWSFAGSLSLMGFEERSFLAMLASGGVAPDTARTSRNTSQVLLHLALRGTGETRRHLLLADVSGEHAQSLRLHNDPGDYARLLRAATCVLLMVDGARLADAALRHAAMTETKTMFRAMHENSLLAADSPVIVVATKWDLCKTDNEAIAALLGDLVSFVRRAGVESQLLRMSARPRRTADAEDSDDFDALLGRMLAIPSTRAPRIPVRSAPTRPAQAFTPGSAVATRYLRVSP